jgi:hypothetical protein
MPMIVDTEKALLGIRGAGVRGVPNAAAAG